MTREHRRGVAVAIMVLALAAGATAAALLVPRHDEQTSGPRRPYATARVVRGTVSEQTIVQGTLRFAAQRTVTAGLSGVVTGLPAVGTRIGFGQALYLVDTQPVLLMQGSVPMWRAFEPGMPDGPDVEQLEAGLQGMGYFYGPVDESFTAATSAAIERLERASGETCTQPPPAHANGPEPTKNPQQRLGPTCGSLALGTIVFRGSGVRVANRKTTVGAQISETSPVLGVSAEQKVVHADVKLDDQLLATPGTAVTVVLPGGASAKGRVAGVGPAVEKRQADGNSSAVVLPTTIGLDKQQRVRRFERASVTVKLAGAQRRNVLSVPVEALVALSDTRFGVEVLTARGATTRVPVKTGLFAAGRVVISGHGIHDGLEVVVPQR